MRAIIFGGRGFLGSHAVEALRNSGCQVSAAARSAAGRQVLQALGVTNAVRLDHADDAQLLAASRGHDVALICVAHPRLHQTLDQMREVEVRLTRRLVQAVGRAGVRRVVQLSSVNVYGFARPPVPIDERFPCVASHPFNRVCQEREDVVREEAARHDLELVLLRPTNAVGRRDRRFLPAILKFHRRGLYPFIGDPATSFSCIDARDVGRALAWAASARTAAGRTLLASGFDTTWGDFRATLDAVTGRRSRALVVPRRLARVAAALAEAVVPTSVDLPLTRMAVDVSSVPTLFDDALVRSLGWSPRYSLRDAVEDALHGNEAG